MLQLRNSTPFPAAFAVFPDRQGVDMVFVAIKATFIWLEEQIEVAGDQAPIVLADTYWGEPGASSLRDAGEMHPSKPGTDLLIQGEAFAPGDRPTTSCTVSMRVGSIAKSLLVTGDRVWERGLTGLAASRPLPFLSMPIVFERAFGGTVPQPDGSLVCEPRNPVGCGLRGGRSQAAMLGTPLPNIEDPRDRAAPIGVGPIAPSWEPRCRMGGTYDDAWRRTRAPYLPDDFDPRFFHVAPADQSFAAPLSGGEPVELVGLSPQGVDRFALPCCRLAVTLSIGRERTTRPAQLETVLLTPAFSQFSLLFRAALPCGGNPLYVDAIDVALAELRGVRRGT